MAGFGLAFFFGFFLAGWEDSCFLVEEAVVLDGDEEALGEAEAALDGDDEALEGVGEVLGEGDAWADPLRWAEAGFFCSSVAAEADGGTGRHADVKSRAARRKRGLNTRRNVKHVSQGKQAVSGKPRLF